jgi:ADP-sugar diphosphatase
LEEAINEAPAKSVHVHAESAHPNQNDLAVLQNFCLAPEISFIGLCVKALKSPPQKVNCVVRDTTRHSRTTLSYQGLDGRRHSRTVLQIGDGWIANDLSSSSGCLHKTKTNLLPHPFEAKTTIRIGKGEVVITAELGIDISKALDAKPFKDWSSAMAMEGRINISKIHIQSLDMFGPSKVGFIKFKVDATRDGKVVPGIVFLRGGAPSILVVLQHQKQKYTLVVRQARLPVCNSSMIEIPAGMLDNEGNFAGVAAKELKEETGIQIKETDLVNMSKLAQSETYPGVYSSCGGSDEYNPIFLYQAVVSAEMLADFDGRLTGVAEEGEMIKLQILPLEQLWRKSPDSKALSAVCLFERLRACGRIPELLEEACGPTPQLLDEASENALLGEAPDERIQSEVADPMIHPSSYCFANR